MIELIIAFGAGFISFLSPCVLPLIPGYISYVSGQSLQQVIISKRINPLPLILFCFGFSSVFIIFGASASLLGQVLLQNSEFLRIIAGVVIIIFSLQLIGIINITYLIVIQNLMIRISLLLILFQNGFLICRKNVKKKALNT